MAEVHRTEHFFLEEELDMAGFLRYCIYKTSKEEECVWESTDIFETLDTWINLHRLEDVDGGLKKFLESVDEMRAAHKNATSDIAMPQPKSLVTPGNKKLN